MPHDDDLPLSQRARPGFDAQKARAAARSAARPGEKCQAPPRRYVPRVDRSRCEGKRDCVAVCPYGVFEVRRIDESDFRALPFLARLKNRAHGRLSAYTPDADRCLACGLCVVACPEEAITLVELTVRDPAQNTS